MQKFVHGHRVFSASNDVAKILNQLQPYQREDAINSLAYEAADMRLKRRTREKATQE